MKDFLGQFFRLINPFTFFSGYLIGFGVWVIRNDVGTFSGIFLILAGVVIPIMYFWVLIRGERLAEKRSQESGSPSRAVEER